MHPTMFIALDEPAERRFRQWARDNYEVGAPIPSAIWHPVCVQEAAAMNVEAWRANPYQEEETPDA